MNVFIDTNVFLSFYHLTNDDLEELRKLKVLLEKGNVTLHLPGQTVDEYRRNRETKIADALKRLKEQKLNLQFPALCRDYGEYGSLRELQKDFEKLHSSLVGKISKDIESNSLKADQVIQELFEKAEAIKITEPLIAKAKLRMSVGNPPGKKGSLGDAINWEALLENVPDDEDLYLIADDRDYFSVLDENKPKEFLIHEWKEKKDADVVFYRRLAPFFKEHYPDIKLASELEKEMAVQQLVGSRAFVTTHSAIAKLGGFENFSQSQVSEIVDAALTNSQVSWILGDQDVFEFMTKFAAEYKGKIEEEAYEQLMKSLKEHEPEEDEDDDFPF
jgi:hypothetical protein